MLEQTLLLPFTIGEFKFLGAYSFSKNDKTFLLSKDGFSIILSKPLFESIKNKTISEDLMFKLVQHGLASVPGKTMCCTPKNIEIKYFIIDVTKKCNFNCIYCFRDLNNNNEIKEKTLNDILNYILLYCNENNINKIGIQVWGGEPLFSLDKIEYIVNFFESTNINASIDIETNASLITAELAEKLYKWKINVGVSIDGTPKLQDKQRCLLSGLPSHTYVENGLKNLQLFYGKNISGITVITKYNYKYIKEILDYYIFKIKLSSIKFNIVRDNTNATEEKLALSEDEICFFANELTDYLQAYNSLGVDFSEGNIELRIKNLLRRCGVSCCISNGCKAGYSIISFDQNGDIFPCEMTDFKEEKLATIYSEESLNTQIEKSIKRNSFFVEKKDEKCHDCPWWYFCQGGCSSRIKYMHQKDKIDKVECCLNRTIYPKLIELVLDGYLK